MEGGTHVGSEGKNHRNLFGIVRETRVSWSVG